MYTKKIGNVLIGSPETQGFFEGYVRDNGLDLLKRTSNASSSRNSASSPQSTPLCSKSKTAPTPVLLKSAYVVN